MENLNNNNKSPLYYKFEDFGYSRDMQIVLSGIDELDYDCSGFEMGAITIWTGFTNAGKTTVMTMLAKKAIEQGNRVFFFNGEQTKEEFKNNLYIQSSKKEDLVVAQYKNTRIFKTFVKPEKVAQLEKEYGNKIFVYNNDTKKDIDTLLKAMMELRQKEKIKVFFLDNFMQIDIKSSDTFQEQTNIMEKLRTFAVNNKVHIHLVAHPRKTEKFQARLDLFDIAGTSNLINKAYNIISILRVDNLKKVDKEYKKISQELIEEGFDISNTDTILEILKTKGKRCGLVGLKFDRDLKTYVEAPHLSSEKKQKYLHNCNKRKEANWEQKSI